MSDFRPEGWPTVVPRIVTSDVVGLVAFLRAVFGAEGDAPEGRPAVLRIGDSLLMVSDGAGLRDAASAFLYVYVPDTDATYARALTLGAVTIEAPADMPYGDRRATIADPWGNRWQLATYRG